MFILSLWIWGYADISVPVSGKMLQITKSMCVYVYVYVCVCVCVCVCVFLKILTVLKLNLRLFVCYSQES